MKQGFDIHNSEKTLQTAVKRLEQSSISSENKEHIRLFLTSCDIDGMSQSRRERYIRVLTTWSTWLNSDFKSVTLDEMTLAVAKLQSQPYKPSTKSTYKVMRKRI